MKSPVRVLVSTLLVAISFCAFTAIGAAKPDKATDKDNPFAELNKKFKDLEAKMNREKNPDRLKQITEDAKKIIEQKKELKDKKIKELQEKIEKTANPAAKEKLQAEIDEVETYFDPEAAKAAAAKKKKEEAAKKDEKKDDAKDAKKK